MYIKAHDKLINLNTVRCIEASEILSGLYVVFADDCTLCNCCSKNECRQIIDCITKAIEDGVKVYNLDLNDRGRGNGEKES